MSFKTKVLMELKDYDDDILVGTTVGTTFHWTIGLYTSSLFRKYFDGQTVDLNGVGNPDNMYINHYYPMDYRDAIVNYTKMLTHEEYTRLEETGQVDSYIDKHFDEIEERLNEECYVLGYAGNRWHVFV